NSAFWLEWRWFGTNTIGYHAFNLLLHIANALLIWLILRRLRVPGAYLAALLFAVHPVNVESVAWIAQLKNVLSLFFGLLSVLWYVQAEPDAPKVPSPPSSPSSGTIPALAYGWYVLSLLAFALAMLSKGSVAIVPLMLLVIVWWRQGRITRRDLLRSAPFFLVAVILTAVNIWFQTHGSGEVIRDVTPLQRLLGAGAVVWFYLSKALVPWDLSFVYPQWNIDPANPLWWMPLAATVAVTVGLVWQRQRTWVRPLLAAWLTFCLGLLPVLGLVDVHYMKYSLVADHYQYIAVISVLALVAAAVVIFTRRWPMAVTVTAGAMAALTCGMLAWQQSNIYLDPASLYQSIIAKNPDCWLAYNNWGVDLCDAGHSDAAIAQYEKALRIDPNNEAIEDNMGAALAKQGHYPEAIEYYRRALQLNPNYAEAYGNLGLALAQQGSLEEAIAQLQKALNLNPNLAEVSFNLAYDLKRVGRLPEALDQYQNALRLQPDNPQIHNNLGLLLDATGKHQEAIEHYYEALRLNPQEAEAECNLANALVDMGQPQSAIDHYRQALKLNPHYTTAHYGLGTVYLQSRQFRSAIEQFEQAVQEKPDYAAAHSNLGAALAQSGEFQQAIEHYQQAVRLKPDYIEAQANLATALAKLNRREEAVDAAEKAIVLARSQGKTTLAAQIQRWLTDYRSQAAESSPSETPGR
ncbi:MAG TPA: tetratricopeptide repeat protein, partial [Pirellulales bacterium]|nr:tetratricopeptide repeat protein [Pirellulales bacterium]